MNAATTKATPPLDSLAAAAVQAIQRHAATLASEAPASLTPQATAMRRAVLAVIDAGAAMDRTSAPTPPALDPFTEGWCQGLRGGNLSHLSIEVRHGVR